MLFTITCLSFPLIAVLTALYSAKQNMKKTGNAKKAFSRNFLVLGIMMSLFTIFALTASADTTTAAATAAAVASNKGMSFLAAGICTGLACAGSGIALAGAIPAAIGAISEDPKMFGKAIVFVGLGETLAIYGIVVSVLILFMK